MLLKFTDGSYISADKIPPRVYKYGMICIDAVDWTGSGTYDLIIASNYQTCLLENVGTNRAPRFKRPVPFKTPDGVIEICHHESHAAAYDWDHDGRLDLMIGGEAGSIYLFHHDWLKGIMHRVSVGEVQRK